MKFLKSTPRPINVLFLFFFFLSLTSLNAQQIAFPTAKGAGAYATGGRGGQVIHVTTLDWDAPGGLKEAIQTPGPRIIVFDVSGEIDATSEGNYTDIISGHNTDIYNNLTIAGQTAPEGGITIKTSFFRFESIDNFVIRYIRFRRSTTENFNASTAWFRGCSNYIIDHCTLSHGTDETADLSSSNTDSGNVTIQSCLFSDSAKGMIMGTDTRGEPIPEPDLGNFTFTNNAFVNTSHRFPNMQGNGQYDVINNVVYNWKFRLARITNQGTYNVMNNYYKGAANGIHRPGWFTNYDISNRYLNKLQVLSGENPLIYTSGSVIYNQREVPQPDDSDMWSIFDGSYLPVNSQVPAQYFTNTQFPLVGHSFEIKSAHQAYMDVLADVGASKTLNADGSFTFFRDSKDAADISMVENDSYNGSWYEPVNSIPHPTIPENTRPDNFYISNAHIPEAFFAAKGISGHANIHNETAPSGYTWLDEYINGVDSSFIPVGVESLVVSPVSENLEIPNTLQLTVEFTPANATNTDGTWFSSDETIATVDENGLVTPIAPGDVTITFTTTIGQVSNTAQIVVLPEALQVSAGTDQEICEGENATLTASGGTSYMWSTGETTETIEVAPADTFTYSVTVSDEFGQSEEASVTVTVNPLPIANAGEDQTICSGDSVILTATGGTSFLWSTGETSASIEVNPTAETTYTVEVGENNCFSTAEVTVFINELPNLTVSENVVIVEGDSTTLTASGSDNYLWNTSETTESITVSPNVTTTYSVSTVGTNGCTTILAVTVTVIPEIIAEAGADVTVCSGDTVSLIATGGSTYTWDTGDIGSELTVNPTATTTYTVTAEDDYGYTSTDSVTVFVNELPNITVNEDLYVMVGNSVTLTAAGGTSYLWSTGETTDEITVSPDVTTIYTVTGDSENGCQNIAEVTVTVVEVLSAYAGEDASICLGESITLNASGGITYTWNTGGTGPNPTFSPTETTTYSVTVTDGYGNSDTDDVTITVNPVPTVYAGEDQTTCANEPVTLTASSENGDSYLWSTGETTESIVVNPNEDTTYTVQVFNENCAVSDDVVVNVLPIPELTLSEDSVIMLGNSTTLLVSGGDTYLWNTGDTTDTIIVTPTETTTYTLTAYLANGCEATAEVTVTVVPQVFADAGEDLTICNGESVTLNATGSNNFSWNTGQDTAAITVNPTETTTYVVTVFDDYGNSATDSVTVTVKDLPTLSLTTDHIIFEGESTALTVNGADTYLWNSGDTLSTITVSPTETTTYNVTGYSIEGCEESASVTITVIPEVIANAGTDVDICIGESVTLSATGSSNFLWNTGQTTASITISPTQTTTYTVTVSDDYGNTDSDSVTVTVNELPNLTVSDDVVIFEGESTVLTATGGETYLWSNGETSNSITVSPMVNTTYSVSVASSNGCQTSSDVTVTVIPEVIAFAGNDLAICEGQNITLNATGGSNYLWNTGQFNPTIIVSPTVTTTYTVTVSDNYGNSDTDSVTITVYNSPNVTVGEDVVIFNGESTTLTANGAESYLWITGETTSSISVNPTVTTAYSVTGFSADNCQSTEVVTVTVIPELNADAGNDLSICAGGSVTLNASGGSSYLWNTGHTNASINVSPGQTTTYTVTVYDNFGNSDTDSVTVSVTQIPVISAGEDITIFEGESTTLTASGAHVYMWSTGQNSSSITVSPTQTTTYTALGYTPNGCETAPAQVTVTVIPQINANAGEDVAICSGESVTLNASGGASYVWNTGQTAASITVSPSETTTYTVTVSDTYGNTASDNVTVTVGEIPSISVSGNITISEGESTTLTADGAHVYLWSTGQNSSAITVSPNQTTTYSVTGYSINDCESAPAQVTVTVIPQLNADAGADVGICVGESVTLNATGGSSYLWSTGQSTASITLNPTQTTTYTVTAFDDFGNSDTDSVTVTVTDIPTITVSENITIIEGDSTTLVANGASSFLWSTGDTSSSLTVSPTETTTYTVIGTTNSCTSAQAEVTVTVTPLFVASAGEDQHVCDNQTYEVMLTANEGDSYLWNTGATTQSITVSPLSTTTYTVTVTHGVQVDTDDVKVFVNPSPEVTIINGESVEIMYGDFVTLSASGANTYEWSNGATQPNIAVSPSVTTTYEVKGYIGECYDDKQIIVNVVEPVAASAGDDVLICVNEVATLTATGGDEFLWSTGETTQSIEVSPNVTTEYTVTVFNALDFDEATVTVEVDTNCVNQQEEPIEEPIDFTFDVYPNPASQIVNIRLAGTLHVSDIYIFDVTGKLVRRTKITNEDVNYSTTTQIDISSLQSGVYFIKLVDEERDVTKKLLVE